VARAALAQAVSALAKLLGSAEPTRQAHELARLDARRPSRSRQRAPRPRRRRRSIGRAASRPLSRGAASWSCTRRSPSGCRAPTSTCKWPTRRRSTCSRSPSRRTSCEYAQTSTQCPSILDATQVVLLLVYLFYLPSLRPPVQFCSVVSCPPRRDSRTMSTSTSRSCISCTNSPLISYRLQRVLRALIHSEPPQVPCVRPVLCLCLCLCRLCRGRGG
jgi:hypothetical protein